jgi:hypothetical protein
MNLDEISYGRVYTKTYGKFFTFLRHIYPYFTLSLSKTSSTFSKTVRRANDCTIRGCIQKFPDWPPGARTANGTALCHYVQFYHYYVSQSSEFCRHNTLHCFSMSVYCCCCLFRYRFSPETFGYIFVQYTIQRSLRSITFQCA